MAGIDKTYINGDDYLNYRNWWIENYDNMMKEFGDPIYLYPFVVFSNDDIRPEFLKNNTADISRCEYMFDFAIWNTTETEDKWLIKNCDITSFRERILNVYPSNWKGFKGQKWIPKTKNKTKFKRR